MLTAGSVQTESEGQWSRDFDPLFDDSSLGGLGDAETAEQLHGGFSMSDFNPSWPFVPNLAGEYHSPEINFGASQSLSMNQGFNTSIPSHPVTQRHQWNTDHHFPPYDPSLNNFGSPKLFDATGFSKAVSVTGLGQQNQFSGTTGNNLSSVSLSETQVVGGG